MSTRRFEYTDEKSSKFWAITLSGTEHTVRYGRIGSNGQSKTKVFDSVEAASESATKLVGQKLKKGYVEVPTLHGQTDSDRLRALLSGLCRTPDDEELLTKLCDSVVVMDDSSVLFESDRECDYQPAGVVVLHPDAPRSFSEIAGIVSVLGWSGGGDVGYAVKKDGAPAADGWLFEELRFHRPDECARVEQAGKVVASFFAGQNGLFFDPTSTLNNGEPGLAFISHEEGGWVTVESVIELDYGQILLRLFADAMIEMNMIPEVYF